MTKKEYARYQRRVEEFFEQEGIQNLSACVINCPVCGDRCVADECCNPNCHNYEQECVVEPFFSWRPCQCCHTHLGGDRYECNGYNSETEEVQEYDQICSDCVYYAEYGQLDDMTMMEIEKDTSEDTEEEGEE